MDSERELGYSFIYTPVLTVSFCQLSITECKHELIGSFTRLSLVCVGDRSLVLF